jgi:hypothetical protein
VPVFGDEFLNMVKKESKKLGINENKPPKHSKNKKSIEATRLPTITNVIK